LRKPERWQFAPFHQVTEPVKGDETGGTGLD
jgi:hypothetical protein